uniref:Odorant receptor n=1 Tax=Anopheles farauti TaxID=69004 RepID=A0A182QFJ5_9DIPT
MARQLAGGFILEGDVVAGGSLTRHSRAEHLPEMVRTGPIDVYDRLLSWQYLILRMLGMDAYSRLLTITPNTVCVVFLAGTFMVVSLYDVLVVFADDLFGKTFVLTTMCFGVIGCGRIVGALVYRRYLPGLTLKARATYRRGERDAKRLQVLRWYTTIYWRCTLLYSITFLVCACIASFAPLLLHLYNGERMLPFGVYLPFVDAATPGGYELNYLYQLSCILWTPPGLIASQTVYFGLIINICIQYDVLQLLLDDLEELLHRPDLDPAQGARLVREQLRTVIVSQRRLENFVREIEHVYTVQSLVEVLALTFQLVLTLYVIRSQLWLPGLFVIPLCTIQLFLMCLPGTLVEQKAARLTELIYGIAWHRMSHENKRIFQLLLHRSQHPRRLTCGGMVDINMNLFLSVVKKVYSIFMMLENM